MGKGGKQGGGKVVVQGRNQAPIKGSPSPAPLVTTETTTIHRASSGPFPDADDLVRYPPEVQAVITEMAVSNHKHQMSMAQQTMDLNRVALEHQHEQAMEVIRTERFSVGAARMVAMTGLGIVAIIACLDPAAAAWALGAELAALTSVFILGRSKNNAGVSQLPSASSPEQGPEGEHGTPKLPPGES